MGVLVFQWLASIGMDYAVPRFKETGITTPERLITLELQDYDLVGVTDTDHRRKLYYLIERIRVEYAQHQASQQAAEGGSSAEEEAAPGVTKPPRRRRSASGGVSHSRGSSVEAGSVEHKAEEGGGPPSLMEGGGPPSLVVAEELFDETAIDSYMKRIEDSRPPPPPPPRPPPASGSATEGGRGSLQPPAPSSRSSQPMASAPPPSSSSSAGAVPPSVSSSRVPMPQQRQPVEQPPPPPPPPPPSSLRDATSPSLRQGAGQKRGRQQSLVDLIDSGDDHVPIRVVVRKRPLTSTEMNRGDADIIETMPPCHVMVIEPKVKVDLSKVTETHSFAFDDAFPDDSNNEQIYHKVCVPLVASMFRGGRSTCFAYGQTGSGKTFTMMGSGRAGGLEHCGLYELAVKDMFLIMTHSRFSHLTLHASFYEIYGGKLFDLLNDRSVVRCLEDAKQQVQFLGLSEHQVSSVEALLQLIEDGQRMRSTGSTAANADSSRSHAILQISLRKPHNPRPARSRFHGASSKPPPAFGTFSFIDLAGSERGADTRHSDKATRLEGAEINTSLLALKEVIRALDRKQLHTPFRGSKLTQVLKDSLVGAGAKTVMIACIAPNFLNCEHTLNTLRYADRVKEHDASRRTSAPSAGGGLGTSASLPIHPTDAVSSSSSPPPDHLPRSSSMPGVLSTEAPQAMAGGGGPSGARNNSHHGAGSPPTAAFPVSASLPHLQPQRSPADNEIEMYAQQLRELRRATPTGRSGHQPRPAFQDDEEKEERREEDRGRGSANEEKRGGRHHSPPTASRQSPPRAARTRAGSIGAQAGAKERRPSLSTAAPPQPTATSSSTAAAAEPMRDYAAAREALVDAHQHLRNEMLGNLREEVDLLHVTDGNRSNLLQYAEDLQRLLDSNTDLITKLKASLSSFQQQRKQVLATGGGGEGGSKRPTARGGGGHRKTVSSAS